VEENPAPKIYGQGKEAAPDMEELLTVAQVASRLQLKPSWVYAHTEDLGAIHVGKYLRFRWDRVLERLEQSPNLGAPTDSPNQSVSSAPIQMLRNR
jgi:hypothetical protein